MKVRSEQICNLLEEFGPRAMIQMPAPMPSVYGRGSVLEPGQLPDPVDVYPLAVARIRELEAKLAKAYQLQERIVNGAFYMAPAGFLRYHEMEDLYSSARERYNEIVQLIAESIFDRQDQERLGEYYD